MDARTLGNFDGWASIRLAYPKTPIWRLLMFMRLGLLTIGPQRTCGLPVIKTPRGRYLIQGGRDLPDPPCLIGKFRANKDYHGTVMGGLRRHRKCVSKETGSSKR